MSWKSRARRLQKATGLSYQQALAQIRGHAAEAAALATERGWSLGRADLEIAGVRVPAVEVVEVAYGDAIEEICARLLGMTLAQAVVVAEKGGRVLAHAGSLVGVASGVVLVHRGIPEQPALFELDAQVRQYTVPVDEGRACVAVLFGEGSSAGLVRLRVQGIIDELERELRLRRTRAVGSPPLPGAASPTGAPAEVRVVSPVWSDPREDEGKKRGPKG